MKLKLILSIYLLAFACISKSQGWFVQQSGTTNFLESVHFINNLTGWTVGDNGTIKATTNGGINWNSQNSNTTWFLNDVFFVNNLKGWCTGSYLLSTSNGGNNWQSGGPTLFLRSVYFLNEMTGWVAGEPEFSPAPIFKTTDGGNNWTYQNSEAIYPISQIFFADSLNGWITSGNIIKATTNGGLNWFIQYISNNFYVRSVFFVNSFTGWAVETNNVLTTTNGGNNWLRRITGTNRNLASVHFINSISGWASGYNGTILCSTNGGLNWQSQISNTNNTLASVIFIDSLTGWAVGENGTILKTTNGGILAVNYLENPVPEKAVLYQNYPNPFNPVTEISFELPASTNISLKIYNAILELVTILIDNEHKTAGMYIIRFDGLNHASGIYYCSLETKDYRVTRKMVLLR